MNVLDKMTHMKLKLDGVSPVRSFGTQNSINAKIAIIKV